jgi:membrane-associated phospholipid phosphatase
VWIALALVLAIAWRRAAPLVLVIVAVVLADALAGLLKVAIGENRPDEPQPLVTIPHSHSFPSGHTATAFAGATALSVFVPRAAPALYVLALAIAYSRLYVGAHFPLDVVGGAIVGVATALLLLAAARRRSVRLRR